MSQHENTPSNLARGSEVYCGGSNCVHVFRPACALLAIVGFLLGPLHDSEIFAHLARGRWIVENVRISQVDLWTQGGYGLSWTDASWLFNSVAYLVFKSYGFTGLAAIKLVVWFLFAFCAWGVFSAVSRSFGFGFVIAAACSCGVLGDVELGADQLGMVALICSMGLFHRFFLDPTRTYVLWLFALVAVLWSNTHGSIIALPFVLACVSNSASIALFANRFWLLFRFLLLFMLAALLSPYVGWHVITASVQWMNELLLAVAMRDQGSSVFFYSFSFMLLLLSVSVVLAVQGGVSLLRGEVLLLLAFCMPSLVTREIVPWSVLMLSYVVACQWGRISYCSGNGDALTRRVDTRGIVEGIHKLLFGFARFPRPGTEFFLICLALVNLSSFFRFPAAMGDLPKEAVKTIREAGLPGPILSHPRVGGFLSWELMGSSKVSQNSTKVLMALPAADMMTGGINPSFVGKLLRCYDLKLGWSEFLASYNPQTVIVRSMDPLYQLLLRDPDWIVVGNHDNQDAPVMWVVFSRTRSKGASQ